MSALIATLLTLVPLQVTAANAPADDAVVEDAHATESPVVRPVQQRAQPRPGSGRRAPARRPPQQEPKKPWLVTFWNIFPPPGAYTSEVGASVGAGFVETAFGGINPNIVFRGHFGIRPQPRKAPLMVYGALDYLNYEQTAGTLSYVSHYSSLLGGAALNLWYGPLRFDLGGEAGMLFRVSSQTDGQTTLRKFHAQPTAGAIIGGGLAIKGKLSLSLKANVNLYGYPLKRDIKVLYGLEYLIGGRPIQYY